MRIRSRFWRISSRSHPFQTPHPGWAPSGGVFTPEIFDCLHATERGVGGEIQLTDAIRLLNGRQNIYAYAFSGRRYDTGDRMGYLEAIMDFALEQDDLREDLIAYMRGIVGRSE